MANKKLINTSARQIIVTILPQAIVALYTVISFSIIIKALINDNLKNATEKGIEQSKAAVIQVIDPAVTNLNSVSEIAALTQDPDSLSLMLKISAKQCPSVLAYYFSTVKPLSQGGYLVMSDDWKAPSSFDQTTRPWFTGAKESNGGIYGSSVYVNARSNTPCISFSKAIYDASGAWVGVVGFDLDLAKLSKQVGNFQISPSSSTYMIAPDGTYLTNFKDDKKIANDNYFTEVGFDAKNFDIYGYLAGESKTLTVGSKYYAMSQIYGYPWFICIDGNNSDFTATHTLWFFIIIIVTVILIMANCALSIINNEKTKKKEMELGDKLYGETQNLVVAAKENAATSQDQSAAVKEIVATMEDNNELSSNISQKIKDVSKVANNTSTDVQAGVVALQKNMTKLHDIFDANQTTIEGIKALGDKIGNIWDIVTLINSVADQAKIIAFNAELEASSAGEAGKNFHIVATEIRRLADGIIDGTKEIKERITEIQTSSDSLILASESGTEKINEGVDSAKELEEKFDSIKNASEVTADSANGITTIIQQQAVASEQILITLKQIASGVENFSTATENISTSAQNLQEIAGQLNEAGKEKADEEEAVKAES